jgi:hypothetical protein
MWQVMPALFLGTHEDARDLPALTSAGITHIVNCAGELPCHFPDQLSYLRLALRDPDPDLGSCIEPACAFIDAGRAQGKVLVHCVRAISRSPAVVLAYLCHAGYPVFQAAQHLSRVVATRPDNAFLWQLAGHLGLKLSEAEIEGLEAILLGQG